MKPGRKPKVPHEKVLRILMRTQSYTATGREIGLSRQRIQQIAAAHGIRNVKVRMVLPRLPKNKPKIVLDNASAV